jgi:sulfite reductase (ferredoxin)
VTSLDDRVRGLRIKVSGCFNSCGQHHAADIGFYGVKRNKHGYNVPYFQVLLGGMWSENAGSYGLAIGAVPSKRIPETVDRITKRYVEGRRNGETFHEFIRRIGKAECMGMIQDLMEVPAHSEDPSFYTDWGDAREFTIGDIGVGECAGEVISPVDFQLAACEREAFEAQLHLERGAAGEAAKTAYGSMMHGAQALLRFKTGMAPEDPERVCQEFRTHFDETRLFHDPFAHGKFAQYYFQAHERLGQSSDAESARQQIEEAQLFLEAAHDCYGRMLEQQPAI